MSVYLRPDCYNCNYFILIEDQNNQFQWNSSYQKAKNAKAIHVKIIETISTCVMYKSINNIWYKYRGT